MQMQMPFTADEQREHEEVMNRFIEKRRPPVHVRSQLDLSYRIENQTIIIFEIRPRWNDPQTILEIPIAKTTWVKSRKVWRIFWMQADLKWHSYHPMPEVSTLQKFVDAVDADAHGFFWG